MTDKKLVLSGATSIATGREMVIVSRGPRTAYVPHEHFRRQHTAIETLAAQGIVIYAGEQARDLMRQAERLEEFPVKLFIEQCGWTGPHFTLQDGAIFSPPGVEAPPLLFRPETAKCARKGTSSGWRRHVAAPLIKHPIPAFFLMAAFAAPLLSLTTRTENFGLELVGRGGSGKSTLQKLMASALGGPVQGREGGYAITLNATRAGIETTLRAHSDMALIMDEANLYAPGLSSSARGAAMADLAFQLAAGAEKLKSGQASPQHFRTIFAISTNQEIRDLASGMTTDVLNAAADRLITFPLGDRPYGVFERVPAGFAGTREFADHISRKSLETYGHPIRRYLRKLVALRFANELGLRSQIDIHMENFRSMCSTSENDGSEARVVDAFGLIMAAGRLAVHFGVLPSNLDCEAVVHTCYELCFRPKSPGAKFLLELRAIAADPQTIDLTNGTLPNILTQNLRSHAFKCQTRDRRTEVIFTPDAFKLLYPNWRQMILDPEVLQFMTYDKGRANCKRRIRVGDKERVFCFTI